MSEKDEASLLAILEAIGKIQAFSAGFPDAEAFHNDSKSFDAALMNFVVIGESVKRISDGLKLSNPQIEWQKIAAFRNIIAHNYFGIDADEIWDIVQNHVPVLQNELAAIVS